MGSTQKEDLKFLQKTFRLASQAEGRTSPNPLVGCVIVKNNHIITQGYHRQAGCLHAEEEALQNLRGSGGLTLYISLEPCLHRCLPVILRSRIRRVIIGCKDPNPKVNGRAIKILQKNKIAVKNYELAEAKELNKVYCKYITTGLPYVYLKIAINFNEGMASQRITGKEAWCFVHQLRNKVDAVLVGYNTFKIDHPRLTCRLPGGKNPQKIILPKKKINLKKFLQRLAKEKITSILVEGGREVANNFLEENLVDEFIIILALKNKDLLCPVPLFKQLKK